MSRIPTPSDAPCPCTSGRARAACCGPLLERSAHAGTAEALMRARYSAFVEGDTDFIRDTLAPKMREEHDEEAIRRWSRESTWLGLEVLRTEAGGPDDDAGVVEFVARYRADGQIVAHRELAQFARGPDWRWVFADSAPPKPATFRREEPKVHRNDPCPCGSGKKHKKCCGA